MRDADNPTTRLRFSPESGRIWLGDRRMILMHLSTFGAVRRQFIETLGMEQARRFFTCTGFAAGFEDAEMVLKMRPNQSLAEIIAGGPQMHSLEGMVSSEMVRMEGDIAAGKFSAEFIWRDSSEDEIHVALFGIGPEPVSWMQAGYASGYATAIIGRPVLCREVECRGMGHAHCRMIVRTLDEWGAGAAADIRFFPAEFAAAAEGGEVAWKAPHRQVFAIDAGEFLVGGSAAFRAAWRLLNKVAGTDAVVLFFGESGVGKEMFARTLHSVGPRKAKPFVAVNCAAIPEQLIEAELFGVERGAFTGATEARPGRFERADGGTLLLDEVASLSAPAQAKLLRALQQGEVERVGDRKTRHVDVRVMAASNVDLRREVKAGRFRADLFYRLNVFPVHIRPLRERREDIPLLAGHFIAHYAARYGKTVAGLTQRALGGLLNYRWPGNVRELQNLIERGVILVDDEGELDLCHLFTSGEDLDAWVLELGRGGLLDVTNLRGQDEEGGVDGREDKLDGLLDEALDRKATLPEIEARVLDLAVQRAGGNLSRAARLLGLSRGQLAYRLEKHNE